MAPVVRPSDGPHVHEDAVAAHVGHGALEDVAFVQVLQLDASAQLRNDLAELLVMLVIDQLILAITIWYNYMVYSHMVYSHMVKQWCNMNNTSILIRIHQS